MRIETRTNLQRIRRKKGLTRKALSEACGISIRTIEGYEQRSRPIDGAGLETLCSLATSLECKVADLLESDTLRKKYKAVR